MNHPGSHPINPRSERSLNTGRSMPVIGAGSWKLTEDTPECVEHALEVGFPMLDTSGDYGTQQGMGEGIRRSGKSRDEYYLVTKVEETDDAYEKTKQDLKELRLEYADLMLIHRPPEEGVGKGLWRGLIQAREDGLTRDIGVSNYSAAQIDELIEATGEVPVVNQIEWSPFGHSNEFLDYCRDKGIVIMAYSPLTRGERLDDETLEAVAQRHGKSPAQVLIRWNLQKGSVPIPKAHSLEHIEENIDIFDFVLDEDDMKRLDGLNTHYSALGKLPYVN